MIILKKKYLLCIQERIAKFAALLSRLVSHPMANLFVDRKAQMAELVDALDSKSGFRKGVQVRFLFWAH